MKTVITFIVLTLFATTNVAVEFSPIRPPSYPLAVRNPYLSAWLPGSRVTSITSSSPTFWTGEELHWTVIARINDEIYNLFGVSDPEPSSKVATLVRGEYTSTRSIFTLNAGAAQVTLEFFSPIDVNDHVRQSLPYSYLTVCVEGVDGATPAVQIYSDIDGSWTGDINAANRTSASVSGDTSIYVLRNQPLRLYQESHNMAQWGRVVYASRPTSGQKMYTASGPVDTVRKAFYSNGAVSGSDASWDASSVVGFSHSLGTVSAATSVRFAIGHYREDAVQYLGKSQTHYYRSKYPDVESSVTHFLDDYNDAGKVGTSLHDSIASSAAKAAGSNYTDILTLSVRQIFGGIDVTIPKDTMDTSNPFAFIKEISSDGNVNTVDIIYPTFPFFYIYSPQYVKMLLEPVMQYLDSGRYPEEYVIHDIGSRYPNATGHDFSREEKMPVEETGNLLILFFAYERATSDKSWRQAYSSMLGGYADYLVSNGLYPARQLSTNDGLGYFTNMTNLAVKSAVALSAYASMTGETQYRAEAADFAEVIYGTGNGDGLGVRISTATNQPYFTAEYSNARWFLLFNLYPDALFQLSTFPESAFEAVSAFYPVVRQEAGVGMIERGDWGKTDWQIWCAASCETDTMQMFVNDLWAYVSGGGSDVPFSDRYFVSGPKAGRESMNFRARPTLGAHFAILAMGLY